MRVLVTGSSGYIARWLIPELTRRGHQVAGVDRNPPAWAGHDPPAGFGGVLLSRADMLDFATVEEILAGLAPDVVVHLAARYGRVWCEDDTPLTCRQNTEATTGLAYLCGRAGARLVYVSSSEVYGRSQFPRGVQRTRRWDDTLPLNMYGLSKLWGEQVCRLYAGDGLAVARLNMPYGPGPSSGHPLPVGRNALHTFLWLAHHRRPIPLHEGARRCFTWVGEVVNGLALVAEHEAGGRFNVCRTDDQRDMVEVAEMACRIAGAPASLIRAEPLPGTVQRMKYFDDWTVRDLGWKTRVTLEDGMRRTYDWIRRFDPAGAWAGGGGAEPWG